MGQRIKHRRDTAANWAAQNPVLQDGELGYDKTNKLLKMGDGATPWAGLGAMRQVKEGVKAEANYAANALYAFAHGLGRVPDFVHAYMECITANNGFAVGDKVAMTLPNVVNYNWDATNIRIACSSTANTTMIPKTGGATSAQSPTYFKIVVRSFIFE
jgi:hypothetical protein